MPAREFITPSLFTVTGKMCIRDSIIGGKQSLVLPERLEAVAVASRFHGMADLVLHVPGGVVHLFKCRAFRPCFPLCRVQVVFLFQFTGVKKREGNKLYVEGVDALNGSPVLDLKCCDTSVYEQENIHTFVRYSSIIGVVAFGV